VSSFYSTSPNRLNLPFLITKLTGSIHYNISELCTFLAFFQSNPRLYLCMQLPTLNEPRPNHLHLQHSSDNKASITIFFVFPLFRKFGDIAKIKDRKYSKSHAILLYYLAQQAKNTKIKGAKLIYSSSSYRICISPITEKKNIGATVKIKNKKLL